MFNKLKWFFSLTLFLICFVLLSWLFFVAVNFIFELISCKFVPWFPKERSLYTQWDYLKDFYYFLGFLDYSAVSLPEVVNLSLELEYLDKKFYDSVTLFSYIYVLILENLFQVLYAIFELKREKRDIILLEILKTIGIDFFELSSFFAYYADVIILDSENGLDKYFLNISSQGWFRDAWEIKGPQIEYLKALANKNFLSYDVMSTSFYKDESVLSFLKSFDDFYLKSQEWKIKKKDLNLYMTLHTKFEFQELKFDSLSRVVTNYDSFSLFYKLVMKSDRFFFDSFYLYFFLQDMGIMFRVNRIALMEIFSNSIIWGLFDYNRYPFDFAWDYNYYGIADSLFFRNNCFGSRTPEWKYSFNQAIPFDSIVNGRDIFLYNGHWINLAIFDDIDDKMISNDGVFEWTVNISEFKPEIWGEYYDNEFWKQDLVFRAQHGPEHSLEPITYDSNLIEEDYLEIKRRHAKLIKERTIKSTDNLRHKYLKAKGGWGVFADVDIEEDPLKGVTFIKSTEKE